ncbi:hypothetical protein ACVWZ7_001238 [Arthrobacter sp. TE12232]
MSGNGGHSIRLSKLGLRLYGHFEGTDDALLISSANLSG